MSEDEEDIPDEVIEVPTTKVKLIVGQGGENIKLIQKKSKCRLQARWMRHAVTLPNAAVRCRTLPYAAVRCAPCSIRSHSSRLLTC